MYIHCLISEMNTFKRLVLIVIKVYVYLFNVTLIIPVLRSTPATCYLTKVKFCNNKLKNGSVVHNNI